MRARSVAAVAAVVSFAVVAPAVQASAVSVDQGPWVGAGAGSGPGTGLGSGEGHWPGRNLARFAAAGVLTAVDTTAGTITFTVDARRHNPLSGESLTVAVSPTTRIVRNRVTAALSDLVVGDHVNVRGTSANGVYTAGRISAAPLRFAAAGILTAVDTTAGTITLTVDAGRHNPQAGQSLTVAVSPTTTILREGATAALADLVLGDHVNVRGTDANGVYTASRISAAPEGFRVSGTVTAIDTAGGTVTFTVTGGKHNPMSGQTLTVTVTPATTIARDGVPAALTDLQVGDHVRVRGTDALGVYTATSITAH